MVIKHPIGSGTASGKYNEPGPYAIWTETGLSAGWAFKSHRPPELSGDRSDPATLARENAQVAVQSASLPRQLFEYQAPRTAPLLPPGSHLSGSEPPPEPGFSASRTANTFRPLSPDLHRLSPSLGGFPFAYLKPICPAPENVDLLLRMAGILPSSSLL